MGFPSPTTLRLLSTSVDDSADAGFCPLGAGIRRVLVPTPSDGEITVYEALAKRSFSGLDCVMPERFKGN